MWAACALPASSSTLLRLPFALALCKRSPPPVGSRSRLHGTSPPFGSACAPPSASADVGVHVKEHGVTPTSRFQPPNVIDILEERGLIESVTHDAIRCACDKPATSPVKVYCGFDPTAESLHLGNLLGLIVLSWFQRCGHVPVCVLGGATARVGDPSGKAVERPIIDEGTINRNLEGIEANVRQILGVDEVAPNDGDVSLDVRRHSVVISNNYDWWRHFSLLDFLRDVGKHARVGTMMTKESVRKRLASEDGMSFTEFTYQLMQGYDFVRLFKEEGVSIQIGGSDQWGNITAGTDLVKKILRQEGAYGLTFPLLVKGDGTKFGKSEGGAIWLSSSLLPPYRFYQHLFATPDADVILFLKRLTFMSMSEIKTLEDSMRNPGYVPNSVQKKLAEEVTRFVHGEEGLAEAVKATEALAPGLATKLDSKSLEAISGNVPSFSLSHNDVVGSLIVDLCVMVGLLPSKGAVRRLIEQGGLYLNNERVEDRQKVTVDDIIDNRMLLLSAGRKNKIIILIQNP